MSTLSHRLWGSNKQAHRSQASALDDLPRRQVSSNGAALVAKLPAHTQLHAVEALIALVLVNYYGTYESPGNDRIDGLGLVTCLYPNYIVLTFC